MALHKEFTEKPKRLRIARRKAKTAMRRQSALAKWRMSVLESIRYNDRCPKDFYTRHRELYTHR